MPRRLIARLKDTRAYGGWKRSWRSFMTSDPVWRARRLVRQVIGTELRHWVQVRVERRRAGGWVYAPGRLSQGAVVYAFGVGEDLDLELELIERHNVEVHAFDPTPRALDWVGSVEASDLLHFHPVGVAGHDGTATFHPPGREDNPSWSMAEDRSRGSGEGVEVQVRRLSTLAADLGHRRIDLLKLDVEGAEYAAIDDLLEAGLEVDQLLVEFHHRFRTIGREETARTVSRLKAAGYRIFHISPSGREYAFLRPGDAA